VTKAWIKEFIWIAALFLVAVLIDFLLLKQFSLFTDTVDIQLHDTYYVMGGFEWVISIFIVIATITYAFKETKARYNQQLPNVILSVLMIAFLFFILRWHRIMFMGEWTVYPPLSTEPEMIRQVPDPSVRFWDKVLFGTELLITLGVFLLGYKTGKLNNKMKNKNVG
jgi:heme/copper-type cytochrome/quinol oxidase subunit 1